MQVTSGMQCFDLGDETLFQHLAKTLRNPRVQHLALLGSNRQLSDSIRQLIPA